jgi:hypothetical protein
MPTAAKTMWNASDSVIWSLAAVSVSMSAPRRLKALYETCRHCPEERPPSPLPAGALRCAGRSHFESPQRGRTMSQVVIALIAGLTGAVLTGALTSSGRAVRFFVPGSKGPISYFGDSGLLATKDSLLISGTSKGTSASFHIEHPRTASSSGAPPRGPRWTLTSTARAPGR